MGLVNRYWRPPILIQIVVLKLGLKEFLERCMAQFIVYIWSTTQHHNINNYLDQIKCEIENCY
jgi:hypothetical protein